MDVFTSSYRYKYVADETPRIIIIIKLYLSNSITSKYKKQKLTELPWETEKFTML